ncbi:MAG: hypothetical protein FJ215_08715 [Ignavibacteria bacterium]|nr:hypothetical protein [Ignavibacteria bacterium]
MNTRLQPFLPLFAFLVLWINTGLAQNASGPQNDTERIKAMIAEGDEFSTRKFDNQAALSRYEQAFALDKKNTEVLWKLSRTYVDIGEHLPTNTDEQKKKQLETYEKALKYANDAIASDPRHSMGYTQRAIANGRIALFKGVWESIDLVKQIKVDLEKAIELNPNNDGAYYVLGRTHHKVCEKPRIFRWPLGLGWANMEEAIKNYEKAISLHPGFIMYRLDCARSYVDEDDYANAKKHLAVIPTLETLDEDDDQFRKEAKELSDSIRDKK